MLQNWKKEIKQLFINVETKNNIFLLLYTWATEKEMKRVGIISQLAN
jgi:hypothetical protein